MAVQPRLAPTAKIPDDAPLAPPTRPVAPSGGHVNYAPPAMPTPPPGSMRYPSQDFGSMTGTSPQRPSGMTPPAGHRALDPGARPDALPDAITVKRATSPQPRGSSPPAARLDTPPDGSRVSNASLSFSPPSRPLGLIAFVLIIDLGLAGAGAYLLAKGLEKDGRPATSEPATGVQKSEAPAARAPGVTASPIEPAPAQEPAADVAAAAPASGDESDTPAAPALADATPIAEPKLAANARRGVPDRASPPATRTTTATAATTTATATTAAPAPVTAVPTTPTTPNVSGAPEDPYGAEQVSTQTEIDRLAARSRAAFDRCRQDAGDVHGGITIAFRVLADGSVSNAVAVVNTTGDPQLASCLVATIGAWRVSPHDGAPLSFMRPFQYP